MCVCVVCLCVCCAAAAAAASSTNKQTHTKRPQQTTTKTNTTTEGYVIVSALMRLMAGKGMCVARALRKFVEQRPPGIYKPEYIDDLFR